VHLFLFPSLRLQKIIETRTRATALAANRTSEACEAARLPYVALRAYKPAFKKGISKGFHPEKKSAQKSEPVWAFLVL
jgi:hypothetical protein